MIRNPGFRSPGAFLAEIYTVFELFATHRNGELIIDN